MTLRTAAKQVMTTLQEGRYRFGNENVCFDHSQKSAIANTRLYRPKDIDSLRSLAQEGETPDITVVNGTSQAVAYEMAKDSTNPIALLNFASARTPGGGFLLGEKAQEEDLCRCSGLYPCLLKCVEYYTANREQQSSLYTDYAIYSPRVPFFRTQDTGDLLREPFFASVITTPAPNSRLFLDAHLGQEGVLEHAFIRRWENVLCIAHDQGDLRLVLGAWGCGSFGGNPSIVASTAKMAISRFGAKLEQVVFAIPNQENINTFAMEFS